MRLWFLPLLCLLAPSVGRPADLGREATKQPQRCEHLEMRADEAECSNARCRLQGAAQVRCDAVTLSANVIDVMVGPQRQFDGATAQGDALLVDGLKVITCDRIFLHADRVQATVDAATIEVRRGPGPVDARGIPQGRNQVVLHGNIERVDSSHIVLRRADITLCDCGPGKPPSWRFDGAQIDAELGERLTVWWPQIKINPLGLGLVPISPPLAPLSIPLKARATGFLFPEIQLLGGGWPTVDLPFFIPLGDSWDLKVALGLRSDWGTHKAPFGVHALGAPRLGGRVRYAPATHTSGILNLQLTRDGAHGMAQRLVFLDATLAQRRALVNRISLDFKHRTHLPWGLDWVADARWVSDDLVNADFLLPVDERLAAYLPSRTALTWRTAGLTASTGADAMLRLDTVAGTAPTIRPLYDNLGGAENGTMHRGPFFLVQSLPLSLLGGAHFDSRFSYVRYGTWTPQTPHNSLFPGEPRVEAQNIWGAVGGLGIQRRLGPVSLNARAALDTITVRGEQSRSTVLDSAVLLGADADTRLARRYADTLHVINPRLAYRALPLHYTEAANRRAPTAEALLDERLLRRVAHQGMFILRQSLWQGAPQAVAVGSLDLGQPVDLVTGQMLQPWVEFKWTTLQGGSGSLWTSLNPRSLAQIPELRADWTYTSPYFDATAQYQRFAPQADRFQRSIYELAAPRLPAKPPDTSGNSQWAHTLRTGGTVRVFGAVQCSYSTTVQLPRPGQQGGEPACMNKQDAARTPRGKAPNVCITQHAVAIHYTSPCDCWGVQLALSAVPQDIPDSLRFQVFFDVAGFRLGANHAPR